MEALIALLLLALAGLVLAAPILAVLAHARSRRSEQRVERLEEDVIALKRELREARQATAAPEPARPAPATSTPTPVADPEPERVREELAVRAKEAAAKVASPEPERPKAPAPLQVGAPATQPPREAKPPRPRIEWERWVGVRGAAVLGGIAAALAGLLLFQHAIQEGWITEPLRVGLGVAGGLALVVGGEWLRPKGYRFAPEGMVGAGIVTLYAAEWAGSERYSLWPQLLTWAAMIATTAAACVLAHRSRSRLVAVLALVGGFATPIVIGSEVDRPFGLFGYVLLLDLGLLFLGQRRRWPWLGLLAVFGTGGIQLMWVVKGLDPEENAFSLVMLAALALVFVGAGRAADPARRLKWLVYQGAALLFPFLFALYFAGHSDLGHRVWALGLLAGILSAAACWLSRAPGSGPLALGTAAATTALLFNVVVSRGAAGSAATELALAAVGLALVPLAFAEFARRRGEIDALRSASRGAAASVCGLAAVLALACVRDDVPFAPLGLGLAALVCVAARAAIAPGVRWVPLVAASACAIGLVSHVEAHRPGDLVALGPRETAAFLIGFPALLHVLAHLARRARSAELAALAAGAFSVLPLLAFGALESLEELPDAARLAVAFGLLASLALAAERTGRGAVLAGAALLPLFALAAGFDEHQPSRETAWAVLAWGLGVTVLFAATAVLVPRLARSRLAAIGAAAAPLLLVVLLAEYALALTDRSAHLLAGMPPAAVAAYAAWHVAPRSREALAALGAAAVALASIAVAREVGVAPAPVAAGLAAGGLALLWTRVDVAALATTALLCALGSTVGLVALGLDFGHYATPPRPFVNGVAWAHLAAAAGALALTRALARFEAIRLQALGTRGLGTVVAGGCAAVTLFVWLNLVVFELTGEGERLVLPGSEDQGAHLALSLTWVGYALTLLVLGMARHHSGPRWASLVVLLAAIGKVFLHDLGDLEGLVRVGSLAGLAFSLILVSLLYQRFVFRVATSPAPPGPAA